MNSLTALVWALAAVCAQGPEKLVKRVVKGELVTTLSYPSTGSLQQFSEGHWHHRCGSTLIGENKLLTAAHCLDNDCDFSEWRVYLGALDLNPYGDTGGLSVGIDHVIFHPQYLENDRFHNDLAIVYLNVTVQYSDAVQPAKLVTKNSTFVGSKCAVVGWGSTYPVLTGEDEVLYTEDDFYSVRVSSPEAEPTSPWSFVTLKLMHANVTKISNQDCENILNDTIHETNFCLFEEQELAMNRPDTCSGDSGGSVMCGDSLDILTGITSWGIGCGAHYPSMYIRVEKYLDWINSN